jgi:hypothetical protein
MGKAAGDDAAGEVCEADYVGRFTKRPYGCLMGGGENALDQDA